MAQTVFVSPKELERQASLVFEGKTINVMLCELSEEGYTVSSPVEDWQSIEVSAGGYIRHSSEILQGTYSSTEGFYTLPEIIAEFTATAPYSYNIIVLYIEGEEYIHSLIEENPNITINPGQTQTYLIKLGQDD